MDSMESWKKSKEKYRVKHKNEINTFKYYQ